MGKQHHYIALIMRASIHAQTGVIGRIITEPCSRIPLEMSALIKAQERCIAIVRLASILLVINSSSGYDLPEGILTEVVRLLACPVQIQGR